MTSVKTFETFDPPPAEKYVYVCTEGFEGERYFQSGTRTNPNGKQYPFDIRYNGACCVEHSADDPQKVTLTHGRTSRSLGAPPLAYQNTVFYEVTLFGGEFGSRIECTTSAEGRSYFRNGVEETLFEVVADRVEMIEDHLCLVLDVNFDMDRDGIAENAHAYYCLELGYMPFGYKIYAGGRIISETKVLKYAAFTEGGVKIGVPIEYEGFGYDKQSGKITGRTLAAADPDSVKINLDIPDEEFDSPLDLAKYYIFDEDAERVVSSPSHVHLDDIPGLRTPRLAVAGSDEGVPEARDAKADEPRLDVRDQRVEIVTANNVVKISDPKAAEPPHSSPGFGVGPWLMIAGGVGALLAALLWVLKPKSS